VSQPLSGRRILLTRSRNEALQKRLAELGATVREVPAIRIEPPLDAAALEDALRSAHSYDWVAFTSRNAVSAVGSRWASLGGVLLASVGPATSAEIVDLLGRPPDLEPPTDFSAEGLLEAFRGTGVSGKRVLFPASDRARATLPDGLRDLGATVDVVVAYRTVVPDGLREAFGEAFAAGVDLVALLSPSAVEGFSAAHRAREVPVAVLGIVTARAASECELDVRVVASPPTLDGLVEGIIAFFAGDGRGSGS
jgi:uroporphyrinogen-III synthase